MTSPALQVTGANVASSAFTYLVLLACSLQLADGDFASLVVAYAAVGLVANLADAPLRKLALGASSVRYLHRLALWRVLAVSVATTALWGLRSTFDLDQLLVVSIGMSAFGVSLFSESLARFQARRDFRRWSQIFVRTNLTKAAVMAVLAPWSVTAVVLAYGLVPAACALWLRRDHQPLPSSLSAPISSNALIVSSCLTTIAIRSDLFLASSVLGSVDVARYGRANLVFWGQMLILASLVTVLLPSAGELHQNRAALRHEALRNLAIMSASSIPCFALFLVVPAYRPSLPIYSIYAVGIIISSFSITYGVAVGLSLRGWGVTLINAVELATIAGVFLMLRDHTWLASVLALAASILVGSGCTLSLGSHLLRRTAGQPT